MQNALNRLLNAICEMQIGLSTEPARSFTGVIPICKFGSESEKTDFLTLVAQTCSFELEHIKKARPGKRHLESGIQRKVSYNLAEQSELVCLFENLLRSDLAHGSGDASWLRCFRVFFCNSIQNIQEFSQFNRVATVIEFVWIPGN